MQALAASFLLKSMNASIRCIIKVILTATTVTMTTHGKLILQCEVSSVLTQRVRVIRHLKCKWLLMRQSYSTWVCQSISGFLWSPDKDSSHMDSTPLLRDYYLHFCLHWQCCRKIAYQHRDLECTHQDCCGHFNVSFTTVSRSWPRLVHTTSAMRSWCEPGLHLCATRVMRCCFELGLSLCAIQLRTWF
jgi:hypothetical protein